MGNQRLKTRCSAKKWPRFSVPVNTRKDFIQGPTNGLMKHLFARESALFRMLNAAAEAGGLLSLPAFQFNEIRVSKPL